MTKTLFGEWGSELPDGDYARAIAARVVLEFHAAYRRDPNSDPLSIVGALREAFVDGERTAIVGEPQRGREPDIPIEAAALAEAWRMYVDPFASWRREVNVPFHERSRPRLAVSPWRATNALIDWLRHPDVALSALVFEDGDYPLDPPWHWPLRVGLLEGDEDAMIGKVLALAREGWVADLSECFTVGRGRDRCDLLVVSRRGAVDLLESGRSRVRASMVAVVGDTYPWGPEAETAAEIGSMLRSRVRSGGVSFVPFSARSPEALATWYREIIREASHDVPIHAAITLASQRIEAKEPVIVGSARAMDNCRLLAIADRHDLMDAVLPETPRRRTRGSRPRPDDEPVFGGPGKSPTRGRGPGSLGHLVRTQYFTSEEQDGVRMLNEFSQRESARAETRRQRWIQANGWHRGRELPATSFERETWNLLTVHIGPSDAPRPSAAPFPDDGIRFSAGDAVLTVQVELANAVVREQRPLPAPFPSRLPLHTIATLLQGDRPEFDEKEQNVGLASTRVVLPVTGDSSIATFAVFPAPNATKVDGRISVIHENRVVQTATTSVDVGAAPKTGSLSLVTATPIHPRDDDLAERREYDVAIAVSDVGGKLHLTVQGVSEPSTIQLDDLTTSIEAIARAIKQAAVEWEDNKPLADQPLFGNSLYALAAHGSLLEQHLRKKCGDAIDAWQRVQLVQTTNAFFPVEWVYDGPPPSTKAVVCPNATSALASGTCNGARGTSDTSTACPHHGDKAFVCPMHFWGFQRVIERNAVTAGATPSAANQAPSVVSVPSKRPYGPVNGLLFAATDRAFRYVATPEDEKRERDALVNALKVFSAVPLADVADWTKWRGEAALKRNLLVLVPHADQYRSAPALEIGAGDWLGSQEIDRDVSGSQGEPQLLLLLGCAAAGVTMDFQPYPERFRDAGVSIVLAPIAAIRGRDAVPIARKLTEHLADTFKRQDPTAFGELMPLLRRELLREGHPGVMSIVGFGDGDWLIGGA